MVHYEIEVEDLFTETKKKSDLYFHLTEAELTMLDLANNSSFTNYDDETAAAAQKVALFEKIVSKAYGQRAENGQFIKNDNIRDSFLCSPEYSAFLMKLISGEIKVEDFILGCLPREVSRRMDISNGKVSVKEE